MRFGHFLSVVPQKLSLLESVSKVFLEQYLHLFLDRTTAELPAQTAASENDIIALSNLLDEGHWRCLRDGSEFEILIADHVYKPNPARTIKAEERTEGVER